MDKLYDPGEHHSGVQIFYPHKTIIGLQVQLTTNNWNDKESTKAGTIKEQSKKYNYQVGFPKGKQRIMEYKYLINHWEWIVYHKEQYPSCQIWTYE